MSVMIPMGVCHDRAMFVIWMVDAVLPAEVADVIRKDGLEVRSATVNVDYSYWSASHVLEVRGTPASATGSSERFSVAPMSPALVARHISPGRGSIPFSLCAAFERAR